MIHNDRVYGKPLVQYTDTKTNIEALTGLAEGSTAYATDTNQLGSYDGSSWSWGGALALNDLTDVDTTGTGSGDVIYNTGSGWADYPLGVASSVANTSGEIRIGDADGSNYISINTTSGNLVLNGTATAFEDLPNQLIVTNLVNPAAHISLNSAEAAVNFSDACDLNDYATTNAQLRHAWKYGTTVHPHLHWFQASANVPNWLIQYRWQIQGAAKTTSWTSAKWDSHFVAYTSGTINQITDFGEIAAPEGAGLSDIIQFRLLRDTDNDSTLFTGADPLTGNAIAVNFDIHIEIDGFGSNEEYVKGEQAAAVLMESGDYLLLENGDNVLTE